MSILDNIKLLYCMNEAGVDKAHEILVSLLNKPEYLEVSPERLDQELKEKSEQDKAKWQEEERVRKEKQEADISTLKKKYQQEFKMIGRQIAFWDHLDFLNIIERTEAGPLFALTQAFNWGYIQGVKAERARRKKVSL